MRLFHGTDREDFQPGSVLLPRRSGFVHSRKPTIHATETILEAARRQVAPHLRPRRASVFAVAEGNPLAVTMAGGRPAHLLECQAEAPERSSVIWWSAINRLCLDPREEMLLGWAAAYWEGDGFDLARVEEESGTRFEASHPVADVWEYRCAQLEVQAIHPQARCRIGEAEVRTWGTGGDMLWIVAPANSAAAEVLESFAPCRTQEGQTILSCANDMDAARWLHTRLIRLAAPDRKPEMGSSFGPGR